MNFNVFRLLADFAWKAGLLMKIKQALWAQLAHIFLCLRPALPSPLKPWRPPRRSSKRIFAHPKPNQSTSTFSTLSPTSIGVPQNPSFRLPASWRPAFGCAINACAKIQISISTPPTIVPQPLVVLQTSAHNHILASNDKERRWRLNGHNQTIKRWDIVFLC